MKWEKTLLNAIVGSSLGLVICCSSSKQLYLGESTKVKEEVNYIPYYLKVYEADSLYLTGNYVRSFQILDSLFQVYEPLDQLTINEMRTYIKTAHATQRYEVIKPTFKTLIDTWGFELSFLEYDSVLQNAWQYVNVSDKESSQWLSDYKTKINWTLRDTLIKMVKDDQLYRGKDRGKKIMREDSVDLVHIDLLKHIFNKYGYPDFRLVGNPKYGEMVDLGVVFNHISDNLDDKDYHYFQKEMLKFIKKGTANPNYITFLVDKREFDRQHKTIYGTFGTHESFGDKMIKFDTIEINRNRKSIGLPSVQYQVFKWKQHEIYNH